LPARPFARTVEIVVLRCIFRIKSCHSVQDSTTVSPAAGARNILPRPKRLSADRRLQRLVIRPVQACPQS
jgi:hypothetical protein